MTSTLTSISTLSSLAAAAAAELRQRFAGDVLTAGAPGYDEARRVWNGAIDRHPAVLARCTSAADVAAAISVARRRGLPIAIRGGGHSMAGLSVCDDGMMIDLQPMKGIDVDPVARTAQVQPGVVWGELDAATQEHGLAVTGGEVSDTGVAGLTLGGGIGWLKRTCGLTSDNLLAAEVVTADGRVVRAAEDEHPDLFWALRGGGGNFGVVTSFTFRLHPVGPMIYGGAVIHPGDRAADALRFLREVSSQVPDEVSLLVALLVAPPAPEFPEALRGQPIVVIGAAYHGDLADGEAALAAVRAFGEPAVDQLGPIPYVALQQMVDPMTPRGLQYYVKSEWLGSLPDEVIEGLASAHRGCSSPLGQILVHQMGGAIARVPRGATPFTYRDAAFSVTACAAWTSREEPREPHVEWARSTWRATLPGSLGGGYVNHLDGDEGEDRVRAAYGADIYDRLAAAKRAWDPENVFNRNQNIRPA